MNLFPADPNNPNKHDEYGALRMVMWFMFGLLGWTILKNAWVGEDSYIAWRSAKHLVEGHGLRWNIAERVQVFTDPLWLLVVSIFYKFTHEIFITTILLSIICSLGVVYLGIKLLKPSVPVALFGLAALCSSKAFIDYATSGLENPMSYLLGGLFVIIALKMQVSRKTLGWLTLVASFSAFNRLDSILFFLPALTWFAYRVIFVQKEGFFRTVITVFICSAPLWLWLAFATVYFGSPLPNTYYSKTNTGIPVNFLRQQGVLYFLNSLKWDTITLGFIFTVLFLSFRKTGTRIKLLAFGIMLYMVYTVNVGADFMSGRFFSVPMALAGIMLFSMELSPVQGFSLGAAALMIGFTIAKPALLPPSNKKFLPWEIMDATGVADEREYYFSNAGLTSFYSLWNRYPTSTEAQAQVNNYQLTLGEFPLIGNIGYAAFTVPAELHVVDFYGLSDVFVAHLPITSVTNWRIGHFQRDVPLDYVPSLKARKNLFHDPRLAGLYDDVMLATRAPYFAPGRFGAIYRLNTGYYNKKLKNYIPELTFGWYGKQCGKDSTIENWKVRLAVPGDSGRIIDSDASVPFNVKAGKYRLEILVKCDSITKPGNVLRIEAWEESGFKANAYFTDADIKADGQYHTYSFNFEMPEDKLYLRFNAYVFGNSEMVIKRFAAYPADFPIILK